MANNRIIFDGLDELRQQLRNLPEDLTGDAAGIVEDRARGAAAEITAGYPTRTGNLRRGVVVTQFHQGRFGVGALVKNTAKHAFIFENGTQARHNAIGANRGSMPPGHVFVPAVIRARHAMYQQLKAMLEAHGLTVTGDAR